MPTACVRAPNPGATSCLISSGAGLSTAPQLAVADGALGFWKALGEIWPTTREQRCWVHIAGRDPHFQRGGRSPPGQILVSPVAWGQA